MINSLGIPTTEASLDRDLLATLMEHMPDLIYYKDRESRFIRVSAGWAMHHGLDNPACAIGKSDADFFPADFAAKTLTEERHIIETGEPLVAKIESYINPFGDEVWLSATKVPLRDSVGEIIGTCGITRNITDLKMLENQLQNVNQQLESRVTARTNDLAETNRRLENRVDQLRFLNDTTYELAQYIHLDELCPAIVRAFMHRFEGAEVALCLRAGERYVFEYGSEALDTPENRMALEKALQIFESHPLSQPYIVYNWPSDEYLSTRLFSLPQNFSVYCAIPFMADNHTVAILQIFALSRAFEHYDRELPVLTTLAAQAAAGLENVRRSRIMAAQARIDGELDAARTIQQRFTPREYPAIPHIRLAGYYKPAYEVGGDYLDWFPNEKGDWIVVIADVCGKGVPAALFMTMLRTAFRLEARTCSSAKELLCRVNEAMRMCLDDRSFVTASCCIIGKSGKHMTHARAGHPMLLHKKADGVTEHIKVDGVAFGMVAEKDRFRSFMTEADIPLHKGDSFLLYTDGIIEACTGTDEVFGPDRLVDTFVDVSDSPDAGIAQIMSSVVAFTKDDSRRDDCTMCMFTVVE